MILSDTNFHVKQIKRQNIWHWIVLYIFQCCNVLSTHDMLHSLSQTIMQKEIFDQVSLDNDPNFEPRKDLRDLNELTNWSKIMNWKKKIELQKLQDRETQKTFKILEK